MKQGDVKKEAALGEEGTIAETFVGSIEQLSAKSYCALVNSLIGWD